MPHKIKTLGDLNLRNKRVLVRVDLNSEIVNGKVMFSERLTAPIETIKYLQERNCKIVLIAHQGRHGEKDCISLRQHARFLNRKIKVKFVEDIYGRKALSAIDNLKPKEVLLLENVRFLKEESKLTNNRLVKVLAGKFDVFVNDAFSASHREQASIILFPRKLDSCIGLTFEKELKNAEKLDVNNSLLILGGNKPEDTILLIEKTRAKILPTGLLAPLVLEALGYKLGLEDKILEKYRKLIPIIKKNIDRIKIPADLAVDSGKRVDLIVEEFPSNYPVLDIGKETIESYKREIKGAKKIFFKGLAGLCNNEDFSLGTRRLMKAIEESKAFSVFSGGHTLSAIDRFGIKKKRLGYVSLSGGALVYYLAGKKLPGIEAIKRGYA